MLFQFNKVENLAANVWEILDKLIEIKRKYKKLGKFNYLGGMNFSPFSNVTRSNKLLFKTLIAYMF